MRQYLLCAILFVSTLLNAGLPKTLYPIPEKRSFDARAIKEAEPYLALSPEKYFSLVPTESPAPVLTETAPQSSSYNGRICPFCGKSGQWFKYDIVKDPDHFYCAQSGQDIMAIPVDGKDTFTDYNGKTYERAYIISKHIKPIPPKTGDVKAYPANYFARERIDTLLGIYKGGALMPLARAYYATGDEKYAERAIAILDGFAHVIAAYPWTVHSAMQPQPREKLLACAKKHDSGFHGWLGPARLGAAESNFRNPREAMYFTNICNAYMMLEGAASWKGRQEYVKEHLIREGSIHFYAYGAKQCVGNAIGMYAPTLCVMGIVLQDEYLYNGFQKIMDDFLYNENYYDGISTEGSVDYSSMVGGMWNLFKSTGLSDNEEYKKTHPFLKVAGKTRGRTEMLRGGNANYGDNHVSQYAINKQTPTTLKRGEEFGGFGVSILRAGSADKRMELVFSHDRVAGHSHDDMLGLQLFYRGIPLLEHYGDTRETVDLTAKIPDYEKFLKLKYPAPIVQKDERPRGFNVQDMTTSLTKNVVIVNDYWSDNSWYLAYRGGQGADNRSPFGNLLARVGNMKDASFQFVEADGVDQNAKDYQGMGMFRRAFAVITRPDGTPYVVDFFAVEGGHRHTLLFHSRGKEVASTLGRGQDYPHLEDLPGVPDGEFGDELANFCFKAGSIMFPGKVLNNVNYGAGVRNSWHHAWEFDYAAWAPKTMPLADTLKVKPHIMSIYGFIENGDSKAIRADGHYPVNITEKFNGILRKNRFQFENAIHYAGILAQGRSRMKDCYVNCMEFYANDEAATFKQVNKLKFGDNKSSMRRAVEIKFGDGTSDIVFWQPFQFATTCENGRFETDARCGVIHIGADGKPTGSSIAGGTYLKYAGKTLVDNALGTLTARLVKIEGDISGEPEKSALILEGADNWPDGEALKGQYIIAGYSRDFRRECYEIDHIEKNGTQTRVFLANSPFFRDHAGEVKEVGDLLKSNQFVGSETAKGGDVTRYLYGSLIVFPTLNKRYHLQQAYNRSNYNYTYLLQENVNLYMEGVREDMPFYIEPDWYGSTVEVMTLN